MLLPLLPPVFIRQVHLGPVFIYRSARDMDIILQKPFADRLVTVGLLFILPVHDGLNQGFYLLRGLFLCGSGRFPRSGGQKIVQREYPPVALEIFAVQGPADSGFMQLQLIRQAGELHGAFIPGPAQEKVILKLHELAHNACERGRALFNAVRNPPGLLEFLRSEEHTSELQSHLT